MAADIRTICNSVKNFLVYYLGKSFKSTLWTAVLIIVLIIIIMMILYPTKPNSEVFELVKPFVYMLISTIIILFIHDSCMHDEVIKKNMEIESEKVIGGIKEYRSGGNTNIYKVLYPGNENEEEEPIKSRKHKEIGPFATTKAETSDDDSVIKIE